MGIVSARTHMSSVNVYWTYYIREIGCCWCCSSQSVMSWRGKVAWLPVALGGGGLEVLSVAIFVTLFVYPVLFHGIV